MGYRVTWTAKGVAPKQQNFDDLSSALVFVMTEILVPKAWDAGLPRSAAKIGEVRLSVKAPGRPTAHTFYSQLENPPVGLSVVVEPDDES